LDEEREERLEERRDPEGWVSKNCEGNFGHKQLSLSFEFALLAGVGLDEIKVRLGGRTGVVGVRHAKDTLGRSAT
jgi:hypothetical protein